MPDSHEQCKHKDKINTKTEHNISSGTCEDKNNTSFSLFRLLFISWLLLGLESYA